MELPTCPSCGQSVLDDDASDCPFCGAAMDGSRSGKKPAATAKTQKETAKPKPKQEAPPADEDPFAIAQAPTAKKVLRCAPKPMKGRLHRIVCPMCDTQGFIPKRAVGRQVKCANRECPLPVFTAPGGDKDEKPRAPARISEEQTARPAEKANGNNKLIVYGVGAVILVAATFGLLSFLGSDDGKEAELNKPVDMSQFDFTNDDSTSDDDTTSPNNADAKSEEPAAPDYQKAALALMPLMIDAAQTSNRNRDKAFCRMMTGDGYLRLNMESEAEAEFAQMRVVAAQNDRNTEYYQVAPLVAHYWRKLAEDDKAAANKALASAIAFADSIPEAGAIALHAGISLAAAMVNDGKVEDALTLIRKQQRDRTVSTEMDSVRHAAWAATASVFRDNGLTPLPPLQVFAWNEPLITAVGVQLAVNQRWDAVIQWTENQAEQLTASDTLATAAELMSNSTDTERQNLTAAAEKIDPAVLLRILSVLGKQDESSFTQATAVLAAMPEMPAVAIGDFKAVIAVSTPDFSNSRLAAEAITDYVIAAAHYKDDAAVSAGVKRFYATATSSVPPTFTLRSVSGEIEQNQRSVKKALAEELKLSDTAQINSRFIAYRRGIDRLSRAAEARRIAVLQMLARVIHSGGIATIRSAVATDGNDLRKELGVDRLAALLFVAGVGPGHDAIEWVEADPEIAIPVSRIRPLEETAVIDALVSAWKAFASGEFETAITSLDGASRLAGLRAAMANYMVTVSATTDISVRVKVDAVTKMRNEVWQEQAMPVIARTTVRQGKLKEARSILADGAAIRPAANVTYLHGMLCGMLELATSGPK